MISTEILTLLDTKQVWEMSDLQLMKVKHELLRMCRKLNTEIEFRHMAEEAKRADYYSDTPLATEVYGG